MAEIHRNYQLKRKQDGKSIANFVLNFPPQNHYCQPTWLVIPLLYILIKYCASLVCCLLVCYCCPHQLRIVDKSNFQNWNESLMENRSLTSWTRTQFSSTKSLLSTFLTCHSSAIYIYTCKVTCLPCMLFTCLFLLMHANYALNYTCWAWQVLFRNGAAQAVFHSTRRNTIPTSGFAPIVLWRIWALETIVNNLKSMANIVNNLKSMANFGNLNVFFLYQWNLLGGRLLVKCVLGWIGGGRSSPVIIL